MKETPGLTKEGFESCLYKLSLAAESLSRIASEVQHAYGRSSALGKEAQKAAETVSLFRRDLQNLRESGSSVPE